MSLPYIQDLLARLGAKNKVFAKIDFKSAYQNIRLSEQTSQLTTIITHIGTFKYVRMPFGIKSATSAFQRIMDKVLTGTQGVLCYLDDILISAPSREILQSRIDEVKARLKANEVEINKEKSEYFKDKVEWLGYEISYEGIKASTAKCAVIKDLKSPTCVKEVRQVLGIVNYYGRFIESLASKADPLYNLLRKDMKFRWTEKHETALQNIKDSILERKALAPFQLDKEALIKLKCDASGQGMGAVLEQLQEDGKYKPVTYWSSLFRDYEKNYATGEKEALACVSAIKKLRKYLLGRHFTLETDHRSLVTLLSQDKVKTTIARVERWREQLSLYNYTVKYLPGKENEIADWLSRSAVKHDHQEVELKEEYVINALKKESAEVNEYSEEMKQIAHAIKESAWTEKMIEANQSLYQRRDRLTTHRGFIFYEGTRFVPDESIRSEIITKAHEGHQGQSKTCNRIAELFWWPQWRAETIKVIENCELCSKSSRTQKVERPPMKINPLPKQAWEKVAVDLKGPIAALNNKYLFVFVDYYSK